MNDFSTIEETLEKFGSFIISPVGISMRPILRSGKDTVRIERLKNPPRPYDMILYKRKNGKYVLHRLLEVREKDYVMCGDNQYIKEYGITDDNILGICTGFYRKERFVDCQNPRYLVYVRIWCYSLPLRRILLFFTNIPLRIRGLGGRILRKIRPSRSSNN